MTTLNEARDLITTRFIAVWGSTTTYAMDNIEFDPPDNSTWVELCVRPNTGSQVSLGDIGNRRHRNWGIVAVNIYAPINTATYTLDTYVQTIMGIWRDTSLSGIRIRDVSPHLVGPVEKYGKKYFQYSVTAEFQYDEIV